MMGVFVPFDVGRTVGWVQDGNGCHIWVGCTTNGKWKYGRVLVGRRARLVHRVRYEREVGPVPPHMQLDHFYCNEPLCCNPAHLRPVTARENTLRSDAAQAWNCAKTHCKRGHLLSGDNLLGRESGWRRCRACRNTQNRARRKSA